MDSDCGHAGLSYNIKYVCHAASETLKNATRTSAIYWFYFTKFMHVMLHSFSKKVTECTKYKWEICIAS